MGRAGGGGRGFVGKFFLSLFLLPFLGFGLWITYLVAGSLVYQVKSYSWPQLTCTVISSSVSENPGSEDPEESYAFHVRYRWSADFAEGTSDVYRRGYQGSLDISEALRLAQFYPKGAEVPCWVNPEKPNSAILAFESTWNVLWILFPLIFVAVGGGGIFLVWKPPSSRRSRLQTAISSRASPRNASPGCLAAFFSIFFFAGLAFLIPFFLLPGLHNWNSSSWLEVPCLLEYSNVRVHPGDDGATYSVDVLYSYEIGGRKYKSSRYDFFFGSDSDYSSKRDFVEIHPAGTQTTCWVNPEDHLDAVLRRSGLENAAWALGPLLFVVVGGAGVAWSLLAFRKRHGVRRLDPSRVGFSGPQILKPSASPLKRLLAGTAIALIWNSVTGLFVWFTVTEWNSGDGTGCLALFLIPFVLIGLAMLAGIPYQILALFNPRPELVLDTARVAPGSSAGLSWRFRGAAGRVRRLLITLEGSETITHSQGDSTRTVSKTFATIPVADLSAPARLDSGQAALAIPVDARPSFEEPGRKVEWKLKLQGEIRGWPDVLGEFEIVVEP